MKIKIIVRILGILLVSLSTIILFVIAKKFPDWSFTLGQFFIMFSTVIVHLIVKYDWEHYYE